MLAYCGDGITRLDLDEDDPDYEACDDGNDEDGDGCLTSCQAALRRRCRRSWRGL